MKLSDYKDEAALDLLAELIEPAAEIMSDQDVIEAAKTENMARVASVAIKRHKRAVLCVLAALDGVPVEQYHCNIFSLPAKLVELFNDPDIAQLFSFAGQTEEQTASGSRMENTEAVANQ
jgi:hypothetical protein